MLEILLVEDNPDDAALALRALKKANVLNPIVVAENGNRALELLADRADRGERFGIVFLDLQLPGMSGLELLERIKGDDLLKATSVVVLTSTPGDPIIAKCYALGANGFTLKPVRFESCADVVQQLHLEWLLVAVPELSSEVV